MVIAKEVADQSFARIPPAQLLAAGYVGIERYITGAGKAISKSEYDTDVAAGLVVGLVLEGVAQQALRGFNGGVIDAQDGNRNADAIGFPRTRPIKYVGEDPNPVSSTLWPIVADYFRGVQSVGGRPAWCYGSGLLITYLGAQGLIDWGWEVSTWPGAGSPYSALRQLAYPWMPTFNGSVDQNDTLRADWGQNPAPDPPPIVVEGEYMSRCAYDPISGGSWGLESNGAVYTADGAPYLGGLNAHPDWNVGTPDHPAVGIAPWKGNGTDQGGNGYVIYVHWAQGSGDPVPGDPFRLYHFPRVGVPQ